MRDFIDFFLPIFIVLGCAITGFIILSKIIPPIKHYTINEAIEKLDIWYDECLNKTKDTETCHAKYLAATNLCFKQNKPGQQWVDVECIDYRLNN